MTWRKVAEVEDLWSGEMRAIDVEGRPVVLINVEGAVQAYVDRCAHQRAPLSQGRLAGRVLTCAAHEWQYDAVTGLGLNPCGVALTAFAVEIRDGAIWIDVTTAANR
jgi:toluene monooxygenase system ferredoxin subunit